MNDMIERIADILIEDHLNLLKENREMKETLDYHGDITHRNEYESLFPIPHNVFYNARLDAYCWLTSPNTVQPEYDEKWQVWQAAFSAGVRSAARGLV